MATIERRHLQVHSDSEVVAKRLGHGSTAFMLGVYSHVATTMQETASAKIANEMYGKRKLHSSQIKQKTGGNHSKASRAASGGSTGAFAHKN